MLIVLPLGAQQAPALDEKKVASLAETCARRKPESALATRLSRYGLSEKELEPYRGLVHAVDRALAPEQNPEKAGQALAALVSKEGGNPNRLAVLRFLVIKDMALYDDLNCEALVQGYHQLLAYRDLAEKAAPDDPNKTYYTGVEAQARARLAVALQARRRLAEKELQALEAVGLEAK